MKLYEIAQEFRDVMELCSSGDVAHEDLLDTLEAINLAFDEKAKNCLMMLKQFEGEQKIIEEEIKRLSNLKSKSEKHSASLEEYIRENMIAVKRDKLNLGLFSVTLKSANKIVEITDESKIPQGFWVKIPETKRVDKSRLLAALKFKPMEGARIAEGKRALLVR